MELRTYLRHFDYALLAAVAGLVIYGMVIIYSATHADPDLPSSFYYVKLQTVAAALGALLMAVIAFTDYRGLRRYRTHIYVSVLAIVMLVYIVGSAAQGSQRWINLGVFNLQPSEMAKIGMVVVLAAYLAERPRGEMEIRTTLTTLGYVSLPAVLVFMEPDFGSALVLVAVTISMLFLYGIRWTHFVVLAAAVSGSLFLVLRALPAVGVHLLKQYQIDRLLVFLHPDHDPGGAGYNLIQSKIAIGSGTMTGKGLYQGTQAQLNFLPEHHTDFIFSVLGEELGFIGAAILFALFMIVVWRGIRIMLIADNMFGSLIAGGVLSMLLFQFFVNIGMTIGIMPITGITLPFISYGGSSMVSNLLAIGLLESIHVRGKMMGDRRYRRAQVTI
ncbi:Rod shape-determining protein RodA [bacterium BMS3Abin01]|nr:Rod shape-determining protein RodA [bacterium BMS3Abin01]